MKNHCDITCVERLGMKYAVLGTEIIRTINAPYNF